MSLAVFGMVLALIGHVPHIWQIVRGRVRPHRVSWFVWSVILALAIWGYWANGGEGSVWFLVGDFLACFATFVLSLWRGSGSWSRLDVICLAIALISLMLWRVSSVPLFMLWGVVIADAVALMPTILKSLKEPRSEAASAYLFSGLAALCGFLAVAEWNLSLLFYPAYLLLANLFTTVVIWVGQYHVDAQAAKEAS